MLFTAHATEAAYTHGSHADVALQRSLAAPMPPISSSIAQQVRIALVQRKTEIDVIHPDNVKHMFRKISGVQDFLYLWNIFL